MSTHFGRCWSTGSQVKVELLEWWESYLDLDRQLDLVAHHRVFSVTGPLWTHLNYVTEWIEPDALTTINGRYEERWEDLNKARADVIMCMRADVGPAKPEEEPEEPDKPAVEAPGDDKPDAPGAAAAGDPPAHQ